jgi:hypothetical protein
MSTTAAKTVSPATFIWVVLKNDRTGMERYGCNVQADVSDTGASLLRIISSPDKRSLLGKTMKDDKYTMCSGLFNSVWSQLRRMM